MDTVSAQHCIGPILELLKVNGTLSIVGAPEKPIQLPSFPLIFGTVYEIPNFLLLESMVNAFSNTSNRFS